MARPAPFEAGGDAAGPGDPATFLYRSLISSLTLSCLRTHGQQTAAAVEYELGRREHGMLLRNATVADDNTSLAARCASVHVAVDSRTGVRPEVVEDPAGRVWLRYRPPHWAGYGLHAASAVPAALGPAVGQAWFRGRHALTAAQIGGASVAFVHTHDMTAGDPWDAGYFVDRGEPVGEAERYVRGRDVDSPRFPAATGPDNGLSAHVPMFWTPLAGAALRVTVLTEMLGVVGAAPIIEHAWRIVLGAYWSWLPEAFGDGTVVGPLAAARLYAATIGLDGTHAEVEACGDYALVRHGNDVSGVTEPRPRHSVEAMVRAWSSILPNFEWNLRASLLNSAELGSVPVPVTVRFDCCGPEG